MNPDSRLPAEGENINDHMEDLQSIWPIKRGKMEVILGMHKGVHITKHDTLEHVISLKGS
jgi:hypothetical protein